jgi:hypothetical protein
MNVFVLCVFVTCCALAGERQVMQPRLDFLSREAAKIRAESRKLVPPPVRPPAPLPPKR